MHILPNKAGHTSIREAFLEDRGSRISTKNDSKNLILSANTTDLLRILKQYDLNLDQYSNKDRCPFPFHKNGSERSASFNYYKNTNSFFCFGCKHGGGPVEFISLIENISKSAAAVKITDTYDINLDLINENYISSFEIKQTIILNLSKSIREFIHANLCDDKAIEYAEKISFIFDSITLKHNLDIDGLKSMTTKLISKLGQYKGI